MKKFDLFPENLWRKFIQARPKSVERAGYGIFHYNSSPEFKYEAKGGEDRFYLGVSYSGDYPLMLNVILDIENKKLEKRKKELKSLDKGEFFDIMKKIGEEAREEFERTKENIPEYRKIKEINKKWHEDILRDLLSFQKPLVSSIPCAKLKFHPFVFLLPEDGYDEWITHLSFSEFLSKLKNPIKNFPQVGDSIKYSLSANFSGKFDNVFAERSLDLDYENGKFKITSDEKQQESKSFKFALDPLGNIVPIKDSS